MARVRLPESPTILFLGRVPRSPTHDLIRSLLETRSCSRVTQLPPDGVVVVGQNPGAKQLEAARARCPQLIELSAREFEAIELEHKLLAWLREGTQAERLQDLPARGYVFRDLDLRDLQLPLPNVVDVSGSDLSGITIEGGRIKADGANFTDATLTNLTLAAKGADFTRAKLHKVRCHFDGGRFSSVNATFLEGELKNMDLSEWLRNGALPKQGKYERCRLANAETENVLKGKFVDCTFTSFRGALMPDELTRCQFADSDLSGSLLVDLDLESCTFTDTKLSDSCRFANSPHAPCEDVSGLKRPEGTDVGARFQIDSGVEVNVSAGSWMHLDVKLTYRDEERRIGLPVPRLASALRTADAKLLHLQGERPAVADFWARMLGKQTEVRPGTFASAQRPPVTVEPDAKMLTMLRDHYEDEAVWAVYADWLVEAGDPRGRAIQRVLNGSKEACDAKTPSVKDLAFRSHLFFVRHVSVESPKVRKSDFVSLIEDPAFALLRSVGYDKFSPQAKHLVQRLPVRKVRCHRPYHSRATFFGTRFVKTIKRAEHLQVLNADGVHGIPGAMLRERLPALQILRASISPVSDLQVDTLVCESSRPYENIEARRVGVEKNAPSITSVESYSASVANVIQTTRGLEEIILLGYLKTPGEVTDEVRTLAKSRGVTLTDSPEAIAALRAML